MKPAPRNFREFLLILKICWWQVLDAIIARHGKILSRNRKLKRKLMLEAPDLPIPPANLRGRVGDPSRPRFLRVGPGHRDRLLSHVGRYADIKAFKRVLEWGCGCGRISRAMLKIFPEGSFYGCDIDPDAIAWLQKAFTGSSFETIDPYPPTPYKDGFFDFIYGISVFTHLDEPTQFKWLEELKRITSRSGTVVVTVHSGGGSKESYMHNQLRTKGIADRSGDRWLLFNHFLDSSYYRLTMHSKDYVMNEWSRYFDILDYVEKGIGRQDIVIMRHHE